MTDATIRILRSMWHRSRREFLPWLSSEIDRRAEVGRGDRATAVALGLIKVRILPGDDDRLGRSYEITRKGIEALGEVE